MSLLEVKDLEVSFETIAGKVQAIRNVSFDLNEQETLAIVGESGSGKSVTCRAIMQLLASNASVDNGEIIYDGEDILKRDNKAMRKIRGREIAMVFQDPMTALNPTMPVGKQVAESIRLHQHLNRKVAIKKAIELLASVGIPDPEKRYKQYPHQFSGGQRQRIVIAIALACDPKILIADEPTTALDVTIQAQILNLMKDIQERLKMSMIFITHDLGVVANIAHRVAVMYAGKIVEIGTVEEIYEDPKHPYTWGLLKSMPKLDMDEQSLYAIPGTPPDMIHPPVGDAFAARNPEALDVDFLYQPPFFKVSDTHYVASWLLDERYEGSGISE